MGRAPAVEHRHPVTDRPKRLRRDGLYAARLAYCAPLGIPLSEFLGWSEDDQQAALQWQAHEARRHPACGTHPEDWDPEQGGSRTAQHWHDQVCLGCAAKERALERMRKDADGTRGVHLVAVRGGAHDCPTCHPPQP